MARRYTRRKRKAVKRRRGGNGNNTWNELNFPLEAIPGTTNNGPNEAKKGPVGKPPLPTMTRKKILGHQVSKRKGPGFVKGTITQSRLPPPSGPKNITTLSPPRLPRTTARSPRSSFAGFKKPPIEARVYNNNEEDPTTGVNSKRPSVASSEPVSPRSSMASVPGLLTNSARSSIAPVINSNIKPRSNLW
jgi:hypothetical protein